jgi:ankyrin repeat protein
MQSPPKTDRVMRRLIIRLALGCAVMAAGLRAQEPKRVAVLDFVRAESPGSQDLTLRDFSRAVQARLFAEDSHAWVERQELERIMQEADPGGTNGGNTSTAVRLGRLLRADLLMRGEIVRKPTGAELAVEIIDLQRAEVLATRAVPMAMNARQKLHPTAAEVAAGAAAASEALAAAQLRLGQNAGRRVLAPLFFRNTGTSDRLGFLEAQLQEALVRAATPTSGLRALQFPRTDEAGGESSLVLAGLTDTDPDAWQKVADLYVWGSFREETADGAVFEDVPVSIALQVSNGTGGIREARWQGPVKSLPTGLEALSAQVIEAARGLGDGRADPGERRRFAAELRQRAEETTRQLTQAGRDFQAAAAGRQLQAYRIKLLEVACFFDPLNRALQDERLAAIWGETNRAQPLDTLRGQWLRVADFQTQAARFSRTAEGRLDGRWPAELSRHLHDFARMLDRSSWRTKELHVSKEEIHRQLRAIVGQWGDLLAETHATVRKESQVPAWYEEWRRECFKQVELVSNLSDPIIQHDAFEKAWPVLEPELGRLLKSADKEGSAQWVEKIFSTYGAMGDHNRATALLDSAWRAGVAETKPAIEAKPRAAAAPEVDLPWAPRPATGTGAMPADPNEPVIPAMDATIREFNQQSILRFVRGQWVHEPLMRADRYVRLHALAWQGGKLWIAEANQDLPPELGPKNPQGDHYLWSYDPALRTSELVTTKLGGHATVRALLPAGEALWIGLGGDGAWSLDRSGAVRRYKGEDGLLSMQINHATAGHGELFFLGGAMLSQQISVYSPKDGKWSGLQVPPPSPLPAWLAKVPPGAQLFRQDLLAVSGDWLGFSGPWMAFYNLSTKTWTQAPDGLGNPAMFSADERGFWLANGGFGVGSVSLFNPARPEEKLFIRTPRGTPGAMAHDGHWLWVAINRGRQPAQLVQIDKRTMTCTGMITLPMQEVTCLTTGGGRLWVGAAAMPLLTGGNDDTPILVEVVVARPAETVATESSPAADFPVHRAVWHHDRPAVERLLAGKSDPNASPASGWTALMGAAAGGRADLVQLLLAVGADPNRLSLEGESALQQAVASGDSETVRQLLQNHAQPNLRVPAKIQGISRAFRPQLAAPETKAATRPARPANVKATATAEGEVAITWEDRADNEAHYEICYQNSHGMRMVVAKLPPDSTRWVDPALREEAELVYTVEAVNERSAMASDSWQVATKIVRPEPAKNTFHSRYGLHPGGSDFLPVRLLARSPLATAAIAGRTDLVTVLLKAGADPNQADAMGYTPLLHAVRHRQYVAARELLAKGAKPEWIAFTGESAAQLAYQWHEDEKLVDELLRAMPAGPRALEATVLMLEAATQGQIRDLEKFHAMGGDVGDRIASGNTPLRQALAMDHPRTAQWLLARHGPEWRARLREGRLRDPDTGMIEAAVRNNRAEVFAQLLDLGLGVDQQVDQRPLAVAAARAKAFEVLVLLRERGANLGRRSEVIEMGSQADGSVASYLTPEEVRLYLGTSGAPAVVSTWPMPQAVHIKWPGPPQFIWNPQPEKLAANAALLAAARKGSLPEVMQAAAAGAELDCRNEEGRTPLLEALRAKSFPVARWLVEEGASINNPSKSGFSPVSFATDMDMAVLDYLLEAGGDPNQYGHNGLPPLAMAVQDGKTDMVARLLAAGANPNVSAHVNFRRENALTKALTKGDPALVGMLLAAGANSRGQTYSFTGMPDGSVRKNNNPSLLMFAAGGGNLTLVKLMLSHGHDPKLKTDNGYDALSWAANTGSREALEYLLPMSELRGRALEIAEQKGHTEIVRILERAGYSR